MLASMDHIVLTTRDLERCLDFYTRVIGMTVERYGAGRIALKFGPHKFNVHPPGFDASLKARTPTPGSLDLCFLAARPLDQVIAHLEACGVPIEEGRRYEPARAFPSAPCIFAIPTKISSRSPNLPIARMPELPIDGLPLMYRLRCCHG